jgi:hypothetical protein
VNNSWAARNRPFRERLLFRAGFDPADTALRTWPGTVGANPPMGGRPCSCSWLIDVRPPQSELTLFVKGLLFEQLKHGERGKSWPSRI